MLILAGETNAEINVKKKPAAETIMKNILYLLILIPIAFNSCKKTDKQNNQTMVIGEKTDDGLSASFDPITIEREYGVSGETINLLDVECLKIYNYFVVSHADYTEHGYQEISTLTQCTLKAENGEIALYHKDDTVVKDTANYESFENHNINEIGNDSYIVVKIESLKTYIGWIKISKTGYDIVIDDYCLYEL